MYYRDRYYNTTFKRFISEDPIGLAGGVNQYAYVGGNPLSFNDPSGDVFGIDNVIGGVIGGGTSIVSQLIDSHGNFGCISWGEVALDTAIGVATDGLGNISKGAKVLRAVKAGVIYLRKNPNTKAKYVGQAKSPERFKARQKEEDKALGINHIYNPLGNANPGTELDVLEEDFMRSQGGAGNLGGTLENKRVQMVDSKYKAAGGKVPSPYKRDQ